MTAGIAKKHFTTVFESSSVMTKKVGSKKFKRSLPQTRGECPTERPCPHVSCRYHLFLFVDKRGALALPWGRRVKVWHLEDSCALDVADEGALTRVECGATMNCSRERIRQIELAAIRKLRATAPEIAELLESSFDPS